MHSCTPYVSRLIDFLRYKVPTLDIIIVMLRGKDNNAAINRNDATMFKAWHYLGDEIGKIHQGHAPIVPGFLVNSLLFVQFEIRLCDNGALVCGALL